MSTKWLPREEWRKLHAEYLQSKEWGKLREELFKERGRFCEMCGDDDDLCVHHKHYRNWRHEELEDLEVLCRSCHEVYHGKEKKPLTDMSYDAVYDQIFFNAGYGKDIVYKNKSCDLAFFDSPDNPATYMEHRWIVLFNKVYNWHVGSVINIKDISNSDAEAIMCCYVNLSENVRKKLDFELMCKAA